MEIRGKKFLVVGGAGFIGSHVVDQLLAAGAAQVRVYENFARGRAENLAGALQDPRCEIFPDGGDILHRDTLTAAMSDVPPLNVTTLRERISGGANQGRARDAKREEVHCGADHWEAPRG